MAALLNAEADTTPHAAGPGGLTFLGANGAIGPPIGRAAAPTTARRPVCFAASAACFVASAACFVASARAGAGVQPLLDRSQIHFSLKLDSPDLISESLLSARALAEVRGPQPLP